MFSKKIIILIFILFSVLAVLAVVFWNDEYSASARRAAFEADRTRYMSDILRITDGVAPVLWIEPKYSYENNGKYFDLSGNVNHATQSTADYQPAVNPPGLKFDGGNDYVSTTLNPATELGQIFTCSGWMYLTAQDNYDDLWGWHTDAKDGFHFQYNNGWRAEFGNGVSWAVGTVVGDLPLNSWIHVAAVYKGNDCIKTYINGYEYHMNVSGSVVHTNIFNIGLAYDGSNRFFSGSVDSVLVYDIALTAAQIQNLYLAGLPGHR